MIRNLLIVFFLGLVVTVAGFVGAAALGGPDRSPDSFFRKLKLGETKVVTYGSKWPEIPGPIATRTLAWTGGEELEVNIPAEVTYIQSAESGVTITGPKNWIDMIKIEDGDVFIPGAKGNASKKTTSFTAFSWNSGPNDKKGEPTVQHSVGLEVSDPDRSKTERKPSSGDTVRITVKGPNVRQFELNGAQRLVVSAYDQDDLEVRVNGAAQVVAVGKAIRMDVEINGAGKGNFSDLTVEEAKIRVNGAGDVTARPTGRADLELNGVGAIRLLSRPPELKQTVHGIGRVHIEDKAKPAAAS